MASLPGKGAGMRVKDIKDRESLQAWLEALPQETEAEREEARRWAVAIAHRVGLRFLPLFFQMSGDIAED